MNKYSYKSRVGERGAVLITALMILLLLTVFGVSTMDTNILEERMSGNMRDRNRAFQAAEAALRACEGYLAALPVMPDISSDGNTSIWDYRAPDPVTTNNLPWWEEPAWNWKISNPANAVIGLGDSINGITLASSLPDGAGVSSDPLCVIEKLPPKSGDLEASQALEGEDIFLQVTARGVGGSDSTVVVLQSVYKW